MFIILFIFGKVIHKEKQRTSYYYRVVNDCSVTIPREMSDSRKEIIHDYKKGEIAEVFGEYKAKKFYENDNFHLIFNHRAAFMGNMQESFDEAYGFSNKERYINQLLNNPPVPRYVHVEKPVYIKINIFQWLWMKLKEVISNYKYRKWQKTHLKKNIFEKLDNDFLNLFKRNSNKSL